MRLKCRVGLHCYHLADKIKRISKYHGTYFPLTVDVNLWKCCYCPKILEMEDVVEVE